METPRALVPFRRDSVTGKIMCVEQDSAAHTQSQELMVIQCPVGARPEKPEFGWHMPLGQNAPINAGPLLAALEYWVPGPVRKASDYMDAVDPGHWHQNVTSEVNSGQ